jgi:hypothetical protein
VSGGRQSFAIPAFYFAILSGKKLSCLLNEMAEFYFFVKKCDSFWLGISGGKNRLFTCKVNIKIFVHARNVVLE